MTSLKGEQQFMCHEDLDEEGRPTRKCRGFKQAKQELSDVRSR